MCTRLWNCLKHIKIYIQEAGRQLNVEVLHYGIV